MDGKDISGNHVYTRNIAHASALIALGCATRQNLPITVTKKDGAEETVFWFENGQVECGGVMAPTALWLKRLACAWDKFDLPLTHPVAYLRAAHENRQNLLPAVRSAAAHPFRVIHRGNRVLVAGANVTREQIARLIERA